MRPSWDGGGWGGPKDGHDKDMRYMLKGEAGVFFFFVEG